MKLSTFCSYATLFSPLIFGLLAHFGYPIPPDLLELVCPVAAGAAGATLHVKRSPLQKY